MKQFEINPKRLQKTYRERIDNLSIELKKATDIEEIESIRHRLALACVFYFEVSNMICESVEVKIIEVEIIEPEKSIDMKRKFKRKRQLKSVDIIILNAIMILFWSCFIGGVIYKIYIQDVQ